MKTITILKYQYSKLDKTHCYYLSFATSPFTSWIWFYLGKYLKHNNKKTFCLYPFNPTWDNNRMKVILTAKVNDAEKQGEMFAKKMNEHYEKRRKV